MATTASGITIPGSSPTTTAATPIQDHWNNLGKSLNGRIVVPVASVTARAALVSALTAEGYTISASNPLYTHRADARVGSELEVTVDGTTWRPVSGAPFAEYVVTTTCASNGTFSGTFPAGVFTVLPLLQCTVQTSSEVVLASVVATGLTSFYGFCAYFPSFGLPATQAGFIIAVHAVQMTATTAAG